jgi:hypothetical protein
MNARTHLVLLVMTLAVLAALFQAPADDTLLIAAAQAQSSGAEPARTGWR